jgi:hypothetical protein
VEDRPRLFSSVATAANGSRTASWSACGVSGKVFSLSRPPATPAGAPSYAQVTWPKAAKRFQAMTRPELIAFGRQAGIKGLHPRMRPETLVARLTAAGHRRSWQLAAEGPDVALLAERHFLPAISTESVEDPDAVGVVAALF